MGSVSQEEIDRFNARCGLANEQKISEVLELLAECKVILACTSGYLQLESLFTSSSGPTWNIDSLLDAALIRSPEFHQVISFYGDVGLRYALLDERSDSPGLSYLFRALSYAENSGDPHIIGEIKDKISLVEIMGLCQYSFPEGLKIINPLLKKAFGQYSCLDLQPLVLLVRSQCKTINIQSYLKDKRSTLPKEEYLFFIRHTYRLFVDGLVFFKNKGFEEFESLVNDYLYAPRIVENDIKQPGGHGYEEIPSPTMLREWVEQCPPVESIASWKECREKLKILRDIFLENGGQTEQKDFCGYQQKYTQQVTGWLRKWVVEPIKRLLGKPPCDFCLMGLGSMARGELSLYSDLDCALLIADKRFQGHTYFQQFIKLLNFRLQLLGKLKWDRISPEFRIDSGDLSHLINQRDDPNYIPDHIQSSQGFLDLYPIEPFNIHLASEACSLRYPCLLAEGGDVEASRALFRTYQKGIQKRCHDLPEAQRKKIAMEWLCFHRNEYLMVQRSCEGKERINLKTRYLAPLTFLCLDLGFYFGIAKDTISEILDELGHLCPRTVDEGAYLTPDFVNKLKDAHAFLHCLRFQWYCGWVLQESGSGKWIPDEGEIKKEWKETFEQIDAVLAQGYEELIRRIEMRKKRQLEIDETLKKFAQDREAWSLFPPIKNTPKPASVESEEGDEAGAGVSGGISPARPISPAGRISPRRVSSL